MLIDQARHQDDGSAHMSHHDLLRLARELEFSKELAQTST
jgi:hypothetical protein